MTFEELCYSSFVPSMVQGVEAAGYAKGCVGLEQRYSFQVLAIFVFGELVMHKQMSWQSQVKG